MVVVIGPEAWLLVAVLVYVAPLWARSRWVDRRSGCDRGCCALVGVAAAVASVVGDSCFSVTAHRSQ